MIVTVMVVATAAGDRPASAPQDFQSKLDTVRELAQHHRYGDVIRLIEPLVATAENPEAQYILFAELGRANFHLGEYRAADRALRQAVLIHPERIETALYLQATSYILGDRKQALSILREVVRSGATDLYLAVTLPGERSFLADPEVWEILESASIPMRLDPEEGSIHGIRLGDGRADVARILRAPSRAAAAPTLTARAGPYLVWSCSFTVDDRLSELVLETENLVKYTPFRLHIGDGDWRISPADALLALGPPDDSVTDEANKLSLVWRLRDTELTMTFGRPRPPRPPVIDDAVAMLLAVRLARIDSDDSDSMNG